MKQDILKSISDNLKYRFTENQVEKISEIISVELSKYDIQVKLTDVEEVKRDNQNLVNLFLSAKCIEGCSDKTIHYYQTSIEKLLISISKEIRDINTNDIRCYLAEQQNEKQLSKVTIDNLRRIFSSFFSWLEDEDYITKSPVRRIHKVRTDTLIKEVLSDENMEILRDSCTEIRDIAMIDLLSSTGIRVGELVKMNRDDIDFQERQCVVFGKGNKEREVYFNARTKIHLKRYLETRIDDN
jgi:site-specific recombinase XerD